MAKKNEEKVLVVSSQKEWREMLKTLLAEQGFAVEQAVHGGQAWEKLQAGEYDALCMDLYMPQMNGYDLIAAVRRDERLAGLPCVVASRSRTRSEITRAIEAGASDYLTLPMGGELLAERLRAAMAAKVPLMSAIYNTENIEQLYHVAHRHLTTSYDFKHPARVNKDQLRTLENLHDNFARLLSSTLSGAMRSVVDVDTAFVDQTTYAEFIMSLSNPSCSYQFTLGPTNGQAIIDVAMPLVFGNVDRAFGGKGSSHGVEARQITPIEIGIINRIIKRVIQDLEATWEPILPVDIYDIELETNPEFMQITAASEIVILLAFEVNSTNASGLVSVCYPFFTLESILPRLGQQSYMRAGRGDREQLHLDNRLRLGAMEVPMVVELGRTRLPLAEANALQEGDVVRLPTRVQDPVAVRLGGKEKFLARPFTERNDELVLKVVGAADETEQKG
jgi:flagellar motor switch protein FliM